MIRLALAMLLLIVDAPASAGEQFDLVCKGTVKELVGREKPENRRYVLDLAARRWCRLPDCRPSAIQAVTVDEITLSSSEPSASTSVHHVISRRDGSYYDSLVVPSISVADTAKGTCTKADFSGFPATKF